MVFVDSDILICALKKKETPTNINAKAILKSLFNNPPVKITIFNYAELYEGTFWSENVAKSQRIMREFLKRFELIPFSYENCIEFARVSAEMQQKGENIGDLDRLIASIIIGNNDVLYTRNVSHFDRISGLKIYNWDDSI